MKTKYLIPILLILIVAQSCTIFSLNPLYTEDDPIEVVDLTGTWRITEEGGKEYISLEPLENKRYIFRYGQYEESDSIPMVDTVSYEGVFLELGDHLFVDLYPYYDKQLEEEDYLFMNFIPAHSFLKVVKEDNEMHLYLFNFDRLKELFEQNRIRIKHQMFDDYIVITASTEELQKFIEKYADDPKAFDDPGIFRKIK